MNLLKWNNKEAHTLFMWLLGSEQRDRAARAMATGAATVDQAAADLEGLILGFSPLAGGEGWYHDVIHAALERVDWRELAEAFRDGGSIMFPENEEAKELAKAIEAIAAEVDVALWYLNQMEGDLTGGEATIFTKVRSALRNTNKVLSDCYSTENANYFAKGFPWQFSHGGEEYKAYLARRESIYGPDY